MADEPVRQIISHWARLPRAKWRVNRYYAAQSHPKWPVSASLKRHAASHGAFGASRADPQVTFELSLFAFAEELDVPARRVRTALARLHQRWRDTNVTFESAERHLRASLEN